MQIKKSTVSQAPNLFVSDEEEMGPEQLAAYRAELAQFVLDNEETIRREQDRRREKVFHSNYSQSHT
jgi:hypothetical protein